MKRRQTITIMLVSAVMAAMPAAGPVHADVPDWVKEVAGFWSDGLIDDDTYLDSLTYLAEQGLIDVPTSTITYDMMVDQCQSMVNRGAVEVPDSAIADQCQSMVNRGAVEVPDSAINTIISAYQDAVVRGVVEVPVSMSNAICSDDQTNPENAPVPLSDRLEVVVTCEESYDGESVWVEGTMKNISNEEIGWFDYRAYVADRSGNPLVFVDRVQSSINPGSTDTFIARVPYDGPWSSCGIEY